MKGSYMKTPTNEQGSAHLIIIIVLVVALLGALGFIAWQNFFNKDDIATQSQTQSQSDATTEETEQTDQTELSQIETGTISGSLTYPSEMIPEDVVIYAENIETGEQFSTNEHITGDNYQYGSGYQLAVPAGTYYVYGERTSVPDWKAYYNKYITCGVSVECTDTTKIEVVVTANQATTDITVGDWWSN